MVFNLHSIHEYMVEMAMFNAQRAITPKEDKPVLRFTSSAHHHIMLYICVKLVKISLTVSVMERTQMMETQTDGHSKFQYPRHFLGWGIKMTRHPFYWKRTSPKS